MGYRGLPPKRRSYISIKLSLISMLILSVVFSVHAYFTCRDLISAVNEQYRERALSIISTVNAVLDNDANLSDLSHIQQMCDSLVKADPHVMKASLYVMGKDNRVIRIASSDHGQIGKEADLHDIAPIKTRRTIWEEKLKQEKGHIAEVLAPIYINGEPKASFGVYMDLEPRDAAISRYVLHSILYALAGLVTIAFLLYMGIRREVFKPLWHLTEGAREVASGNLRKRINLRRNDELGELSQEFDNMTETLQQREQENQRLQEALREKWRKAEIRASTDQLTKLKNHQSFHVKLEAELNRASRQDEPTSLLFCDLDKFKPFNDTHGHLLGDKALKETAQIIKDSIRAYDIAARYGGEEFVVILPGTDSDEATWIGERIRRHVEDHQFTAGHGYAKLMISIGVATYPGSIEKRGLIVAAADHAMYQSKKQGGNSVTLFKSFGSITPTKAS